MQGGIHSLHKFTHEINQVHPFRCVRTLSPGLLEHLGTGHHGVYERWYTGTARWNLADFHTAVQRNRCVRVVRIGNPSPAEHVDEHLLAVDGFFFDTHVRLGRILERPGRSGPPMGKVILDSVDG